MGNLKRAAAQDKEYVRVISSIRGVDFSGDPDAISKGRLPIIENMYRNYSSPNGAMLESIPGFRRILELTGKRINALFLQKIGDRAEYLLIHAGKELYRISTDNRDDIGGLRSIATLKDARSTGFSFGDDFYILDGRRLTVIDKDGTAHTTSEEGAIYAPVTFHNGEPMEQANLLGGEFIEQTTVTDPSEIFYATPELKYEITSHTDRLCTVCGVSDKFSGSLYIPTYTRIGGELFLIDAIADHAFENNSNISELIIADGVRRIGKYALAGCTDVVRIVLPNTLEVIEDYAFDGCQSINQLYIGECLAEIKTSSFHGCKGITDVYYFSDENSYCEIENYGYIPYLNIHYQSPYTEIALGIPITTKAESITDVTLEGAPLSYEITESDGLINCVIVYLPDIFSVTGRTIRIRGISDARVAQHAIHGQDAREVFRGDLIEGCTVAQVFDGRIFLSGNPQAPSAIFFSTDKLNASDKGLYFGALDYLCVGSSSYSTMAMLAAQETLAVFKSGDGADGGIFYCKRQKLYDRVRTVGYEVSYTHNGIYAAGDAIAFFDDLLFLSKKGLLGLDKSANGISRSIACRSLNVNSRLLSEPLSEVRMTSWLGYLVLAVGNRMYLADSRATYTERGERGYEWFYLTDIGVGDEGRTVYRFASLPFGKEHAVYHSPDSLLHEDADVIHIDDSKGSPMGQTYYTVIDGKRYHIYKSDEIIYDRLSPICAVASTENLLFFGCENGAVCIFNNDLISQLPERITDANEDASDACPDGVLHPDYYSFAGARARYVIGTGNDDLGIPYMAKSTVTGSLVLTVQARDSAELGVYTDTRRVDEKGCAGVGTLNFYDLSFDNLTFETELRKKRVFRLRERGFAERDMRVICDRPRSPIGILSLACRYKICGRIKAR